MFVCLQTEKEKAKEAEKKKSGTGRAAPTTRMQRTARAFKYVWPESRALRLRLVACFVLVIGERCVNLAVPVLYKNMVDQLGVAGAAVAGGGGGSGGQLKQLLAAAGRLVAAEGGAGAGAGAGAAGVLQGVAAAAARLEAREALVTAARGILKVRGWWWWCLAVGKRAGAVRSNSGVVGPMPGGFVK